MLKLNAIFHRKDDNLHPRSCVVEKVIPLTGAQFRRFASDMLSDWDFIKDNVDLMRMDSDGTYHCILVTGEGCENGILVESEGSTYARYAAHVPHVHSIIAANRYPAIADLTNKLTAMADHIVEAAAQLRQGENRVVVSMDELEEISGIDVARNTAITSILTKMLNERPEIADWELDKSEFIVTPAPAVPEQKQAPAPEQTREMTMSM